MTYDHKKARENHREILRLKCLGLKNTEIAEQLNITPLTVANVVESPLYKGIIQTLQGGADQQVININDRIQKLAPVALDVMESIITKGAVYDKELKANEIKNTAVDLLSMAGYGKIARVNANINHNHLTAEQIKEINDRAEELKNKDMMEVEAQVI